MKVVIDDGCTTCRHKTICKYKEETEEIMKILQPKVDKLNVANEYLKLNVVCSQYKYY